MNVAYMPGCSLHGMAAEYEKSAQVVCRHLGINLQEIEDWNCCGATAAHSLNNMLSISLSARNLNIARQMKLDQVTTACAGCFNRLKTASYEMQRDPETAKKVEKIIDASAPTGLQISNLLQLLMEQLGVGAISEKVVKPLKGLKLASYYGCLMTRPAKIAQFDDPEQPVSLDLLLNALGAETVTWGYKTECCGGGYSASETSIVVDLSGQILEAARVAGAEAIVTACPMCQSNLDSRQSAIEAARNKKYNLPIIYFTQLIGLAFGYSPQKVGLNRLLTNPTPLLKGKGLM